MLLAAALDVAPGVAWADGFAPVVSVAAALASAVVAGCSVWSEQPARANAAKKAIGMNLRVTFGA